MGIAVEVKTGYAKKEVGLNGCCRVEELSRDEGRREVEYEKNRLVYILVMPIVWALVGYVFVKKMVWQYALGKKVYTNTIFFDGFCRPLRAIKDGAASWRALDMIYNYFEKYRYFHPVYYPNGLGWFERLIADFWIGNMNAQAVRNRRKYIAEKLAGLIKKVAENSNEVRIFSIASGSAQAVFEAIQQSGISASRVKISLLDIDEMALVYSRNLAKAMEAETFITMICGNTANVGEVIKEFNPHIIEMVGFLDYRPDIKAVKLFRKIYEPLMIGGYFITANICPNPEMGFLKWDINWPMIYRRKENLVKILEEGGFRNCCAELEPQRIHAIAIAQK